MRLLTENDYKVMSKVLDRSGESGISKTTGTTVNIVAGKSNLSISKVRDALNTLIEYGFIDMGISKGREKTYFITPEGMLELKSITQKSISIKGDVINE